MNYSQRLNSVIPGGAHTYSRGDDQFPALAPPILERGKGAYVYTPEGDSYLDYGMGLRAVTLGYAEERINNAAIKQIMNGNNLTRASVVELEAAEAFVDLIPGADMVKFAKNGSNVTTAAVKIARAATGRPYIARCAEHPFFSFDDWFIGDTPLTMGIPPQHHALTLNFHYDNLASLRSLFDAHPAAIAGVILEPATSANPSEGFLQGVHDLCRQYGALLIFDEMITGFRWHLQGAQTLYNVTPDLSTFGKGMANGFSVAALVGKREYMDLGSIKATGKQKLFLTSTTHGAEMCGMGALLETIAFYREHNVIEHLWSFGAQLVDGMNAEARAAGIEHNFVFGGVPCSPYFTTLDGKGEACMGMRTLFVQEMLRGGVLMPWVALSYAHKKAELEKTLEAARAALRVYAQAVDVGFERFLHGPAAKPVFRPFV